MFLTTGTVNKDIKSKRKLQRTIFIIIWGFLMFYQIFLSPQVKRNAIISPKHSIDEFPRELPNDLRLKTS